MSDHPTDFKGDVLGAIREALDGFFAILETFRRHGRRLDLDTPGLRLADPAFAAAVSRYDVHLTLSCQAASDEVYAAMTGNPHGFTLVRAAIDNLRHTRIPFGVNCVVTAINCGSLFDIARFLLIGDTVPAAGRPLPKRERVPASQGHACVDPHGEHYSVLVSRGTRSGKRRVSAEPQL